MKRSVRLVSSGLFLVCTLGATSSAIGQPALHSLVASPDIYKIIAENAQHRVIEVTWKPGQRDQTHSHPASAVYYPMDCTLRSYDASGMVVGERSLKAGFAVVQQPIAAHAIENTGQSECKVIMFEPR